MILYFRYYVLFFFNQKTAYDMRISDWSSDVCSSDLHPAVGLQSERTALPVADDAAGTLHHGGNRQVVIRLQAAVYYRVDLPRRELRVGVAVVGEALVAAGRSEEHTSELQSLMRISYAVFCLKKKKDIHGTNKKH